MLLPQNDSVRGSGAALATPASRLVGTLAVPLAKSWNAASAFTTVPAGAPCARSAPGSPLPAHATASSA